MMQAEFATYQDYASLVTKAAALDRIHEHFRNNNVEDADLLYFINQRLNEAYGPTARPAPPVLVSNGNVHYGNQYWQAHADSRGVVHRFTGFGTWVICDPDTANTYAPFAGARRS